MAVLSGGVGEPWPPSFLLNFMFKFVSLTYTADNFQLAKL